VRVKYLKIKEEHFDLTIWHFFCITKPKDRCIGILLQFYPEVGSSGISQNALASVFNELLICSKWIGKGLEETWKLD